MVYSHIAKEEAKLEAERAEKWQKWRAQSSSDHVNFAGVHE